MIKETKAPEDNAQDLQTYRLDLTLSGNNFPSGCFARIFQRTIFTRQNWILFAATEAVENNPNPLFTAEIHLEYLFSVQQEIRVEIVATTNYDLAGAVEFKFANLLNAANQTLALAFRRGNEPNDPESTVIIKVDNTSECMDEVRLEFGANFFKSFVFKPRTYFTLWRLEEDGKFASVFQSDQVDSSIPIWPAVQLKVNELCKKDFSKVLRVLVHYVPKMGQTKIMGHADFTLQDVFKDMVKTFNIVKFSRKAEKNFMKKQVGKLFVQHKEMIRDPQFIDYLFEGLDISSALAIDFSGLNLEDTVADPATKLIEQAFSPIVDILTPYNLSKTVSCFGFGARNTTTEVSKVQSECFLLGSCSDLTNSEEVKQAYRETLQKDSLKLNAGQDITTVIKSILSVFQRDLFFSSNLRYYVIVLILEQANGETQQLVDYVTSISQSMPISIFLVGVGKGPFTSLECFDIFERKGFQKDSQGNILNQTTINFVRCQNIESDEGIILAKELLKVIPSRVTSFMKRSKERPMPKPAAPVKPLTIFGPMNNNSPDTLRSSISSKPS